MNGKSIGEEQEEYVATKAWLALNDKNTDCRPFRYLKHMRYENVVIKKDGFVIVEVSISLEIQSFQN